MSISVQQNGRRYKAVVTITAGTPIPIFPSAADYVRLDRVSIQMLPGGSGNGKVYNDVPPNTPAAGIAAACGQPEILSPPPGDGLSPGGNYFDQAGTGGFLDGREFAIDGSHSGDTVLVDCRFRI